MDCFEIMLGSRSINEYTACINDTEDCVTFRPGETQPLYLVGDDCDEFTLVFRKVEES